MLTGLFRGFFPQYLYPGSFLRNIPSISEHRAGRPQVAGVAAEIADDRLPHDRLEHAVLTRYRRDVRVVVLHIDHPIEAHFIGDPGG